MTITGTGNYTGTKEVTFNITKKAAVDLSKESTGTVISDIAGQTYTGKEITPAVTVTAGGKTLEKDTDYTVAYSENVKAGTATVTVSGKKEYTGSVQKTFKILPASMEAVAVAAVEDLTYTGQPLKPELTVTFGSDAVPVVKEQDYTVAYEKNTAAGTEDITLTAAADGNFTGTKKVTFKILPAAFSDNTVTCEMKDKLEYTGEPVTQETLKVTFGGQEFLGKY